MTRAKVGGCGAPLCHLGVWCQRWVTAPTFDRWHPPYGISKVGVVPSVKGGCGARWVWYQGGCGVKVDVVPGGCDTKVGVVSRWVWCQRWMWCQRWVIIGSASISCSMCRVVDYILCTHTSEKLVFHLIVSPSLPAAIRFTQEIVDAPCNEMHTDAFLDVSNTKW